MIEVYIGVCWYTIDDQPNWNPSMNARKSRVRENNYNGKVSTIYETVGDAPKLEELWYDNVWMKYVGDKMPRFNNNLTGPCRPDTIFDYPQDLIEVLKKYKKDPRTKDFVCGTGKFWVESPNQHLERGESPKVDPNPKLEEVTKMVMLFETEQEAEAWIIEVMDQVKGFTPEQIQKNKNMSVEPVYSDEEEERSPILSKLETFIQTIAKNADHFCKPENVRQLHWAMWRFGNIFYAARSAKCGYEDSIGYFLESFDWSDGLTDEQIKQIELATQAEHKLAHFGYVDREFLQGGGYVCGTSRLRELELSEPSEATLLAAKSQKSFDDHVKLSKLIYGSATLSPDLLLTYYGGYDFIDGYMVSDEVIDPMFVYGYRDVPVGIMEQLNEVLRDSVVLATQDTGRDEWEKDLVYYYEKQFMGRKDIPAEIKSKMKKFDFSQWVHFSGKFLELASVVKKKPYKLVLGIDPIINKITKDSHPSYVQAAIDISNKILMSKASDEKDRKFAKGIIKKLST